MCVYREFFSELQPHETNRRQYFKYVKLCCYRLLKLHPTPHYNLRFTKIGAFENSIHEQKMSEGCLLWTNFALLLSLKPSIV